jgi:hypothetical protein
MAAPARFHDTGARSDFDRLTERCYRPQRHPAKLQFNPAKRLFNGAAGWPELVSDQGSLTAFLSGAMSHSCQSGRLRVALSPSPTEAGGSRPFLFAMPPKTTAMQIFRVASIGHLPFAACMNSDVRGNPSSCADIRRRPRAPGVKQEHPKPPYNSSHPFSISDAYPRTIESGISTLLVSLTVGKDSGDGK